MKKSNAIRAAIYARVSTTGKGQDVGLQVDELKQLAKHRGWTVTDVYKDEGISGAKERRPGLDRALADAQAGRFDLLVVWKMDRLGRSLKHLLNTLDDLTTWNIGFVSVRDAGIDTTTPAGRLMLQMLGAFAEFERAIIQERVQAGVRHARDKGIHCGRPKVTIDIRPALAMFQQGHGLKTTARSMGVPVSTLRRRLAEAGEWPRL